MNLVSSKDPPFGGKHLDGVRGRVDGRPRSLRSSATDITGLGPGVFLASPTCAPLSSLVFGFRARVGPKNERTAFHLAGSFTHDRGRMFKNVLVPQPKHPLAGRRWFSKTLETAGLAQSTAYEALVARARSAIAPAAAVSGRGRGRQQKRSGACGEPLIMAALSRKTRRKDW